jgi:hypothetical protein
MIAFVFTLAQTLGGNEQLTSLSPEYCVVADDMSSSFSMAWFR